MMSVVDKLKKIRDAMNGVSSQVYHYKRPKDVKPAWRYVGEQPHE